jgi:hypothetical protein
MTLFCFDSRSEKRFLAEVGLDFLRFFAIHPSVLGAKITNLERAEAVGAA